MSDLYNYHLLKAEGQVVKLGQAVPEMQLELMQRLVDGYIEKVPDVMVQAITSFQICEGTIAYCDEEGKFKGKPYNTHFKDVFTDFIVGDVLLQEPIELGGSNAGSTR